jgi:hypothetical protein
VAASCAFGYRIYGSNDTDVMVQLHSSVGLIGTAHMSLKGDMALTKLPVTGMSVSLPVSCNPACPSSSLAVLFFPGNVLAAKGYQENTNFEAPNPIAKMRAVRIEDISINGPLVVGQAPLPPQLQGLFWLTHQKSSSALVAFGGPNDDGGGLSTGFVQPQGRYGIRVQGERAFSSATVAASDILMQRIDAVYAFTFDNQTNPTFARIFSERAGGMVFLGRGMGWIMNLTMKLMPQGMPEYPGSVTWLRESTMLGFNMGENYNLVQVMDSQGNRLPAWTKFAAYQNSEEAGAYPGWIFYPSRYPSPSPGAEEKMKEVMGSIKTQMILMDIGLFIGLPCLCCFMVLCCAPCLVIHCLMKKSKKGKKKRSAYVPVDTSDYYGNTQQSAMVRSADVPLYGGGVAGVPSYGQFQDVPAYGSGIPSYGQFQGVPAYGSGIPSYGQFQDVPAYGSGIPGYAQLQAPAYGYVQPFNSGAAVLPTQMDIGPTSW